MSSENAPGGSHSAQRDENRAESGQTLALIAGGIAHDFNNLLHTIRARIELALRIAGTSADIAAHLEGALKCTEDAETLTTQLRALARGKPLEPKPHDLRTLIQRAVNRSISDDQVECNVALPTDAVVAEVDEQQFHQLLRNLLGNAAEAMPDGGRIDVVLEQQSAGEASDRFVLPAPAARLRVSDTGPGIDAAAMPRIFDADYTTKQDGTGLGLAICQNVARNHSAVLRCHSEPGKGTTFELTLPLPQDPNEH